MVLFQRIEEIIIIFSNCYPNDKLNIIEYYKKVKNDTKSNFLFSK